VLAGVIIAVSAYLLSLLKSKDAELGGAVTVPIIMVSTKYRKGLLWCCINVFDREA
jgi:hypothetical protein